MFTLFENCSCSYCNLYYFQDFFYKEYLILKRLCPKLRRIIKNKIITQSIIDEYSLTVDKYSCELLFLLKIHINKKAKFKINPLPIILLILGIRKPIFDLQIAHSEYYRQDKRIFSLREVYFINNINKEKTNSIYLHYDQDLLLEIQESNIFPQKNNLFYSEIKIKCLKILQNL